VIRYVLAVVEGIATATAVSTIGIVYAFSWPAFSVSAFDLTPQFSLAQPEANVIGPLACAGGDPAITVLHRGIGMGP